MPRARLLGAPLLAFLLALGVLAVTAAACEGGGSGGKELTSLSTTLSGEGKEGEEITVAEGAKVKDKATLTGKNASKATGKVKYKIYSEKECKALVKEAGEVTVSGESVPASSEEELEAGKAYYWQAHYGGDEKNDESTSPCTEVLKVQAKTSLSTKLSGGGEEGEEITVNEGTKVKDKATLTGTNSSSAEGKVLYKIFSDKECKTLVKEAGEESVSGGSVTASSEEELEGGKTYYWQATYKGDSLHKESTSSCGSEVLKVKAKTTLATTLSGGGEEGDEISVNEGTKAKDKATVEGTNASSAEGKVLYKVYSDSKCEHLVTEAGEKSVTSGAATASSEEELEGGKTYYWQATYKGDSLHQESTSTCGKEILTVKAKTTLSTTLSGESKEGEALVLSEETAVHDTATLSGTNSSKASGSVKYKVYSNEACTELIKEAGEVTVTTGSVPASNSETLSDGTYYWQAVYSGDTLHQASTSTCGAETQLVAAPTEVTTSLSSGTAEGTKVEVLEGEPVVDTATLHGKNAFLATGTVTYNVYSDNKCTKLADTVDIEPVTGELAPTSLGIRLSAGTYYWQVVYSGDLHNQSSISTCGSETEVINAPAITTSLSGEEKTGEALEVQEGAEVSDAATLHSENPSTATGTVTYSVYSDSECTKLIANAGKLTVESGGKVPASNKESLAAGTYFWQAEYSGDSSHKAASSTCGTELQIVADATTITTSLSGEEKTGETLEVQENTPVTDTATLHGSKASTATGTVAYNIYSDSKCEHLVASAGEVTVTSGSVPRSFEKSLPAGTYYWQAVYTGNTANQQSTSTCGAEIETVVALTTSLFGGGHTGEVLEVQEETPVTDTATLHGSTASTATGSVEYNVYSDSKCEHLVANAGEATMTKGVASESKAETLAPGTYYWQAYYKGDTSHPSRKSACGSEEEKVFKGPPVWVVSVGDSYISGEGGRWAGNTMLNREWPNIDALGSEAYYGEPNGEPGGEEIPLCHRSKSAEIFIGGGIKSKNFACSGAETLSYSYEITRRWIWWGAVTGGIFKPGLDFVKVKKGEPIKEGAGPERGPCPLTECVGQAKKLEEFAKERKKNGEQIKMVTVSIGGNDFEFPTVVKECTQAYAFPLVPFLNEECSKTREKYFENVQAEKEKAIEGAITRVGEAMEKAGFAKNEYTIVIQDYPSPIPAKAAEFRYTEDESRILAGALGLVRPVGVAPAGPFPSREVVGACPFRDSDAEWANATALKKIDETEKKAFKNVKGGKYQVAFMELEGAFSPNANEKQGRRLCEKGLTLIGGENFLRGSPLNWLVPLVLNPLMPTTVNETEWFNQLRVRTWNLWGLNLGGTPFLLQEDIHPNFWGQLALRNCLRKEYKNGAPKEEGTCVIEKPGLTAAPGGPPPAVAGELPVVRNEPLMELK